MSNWFKKILWLCLVTIFTTSMFSLTYANTAPSITGTSNVLTQEDSQSNSIFTISDAESSANTLVISFESSNPSLIPIDHITTTNNNGVVTATFSPLANMYGSSMITIHVFDGTVTSSTTIMFTAVAMNDPPSITGTSNITIGEDSATRNVFWVNDLESFPGDLVVSFGSSNTALLPISNILNSNVNGTVTVTMNPVANAFGTSTITIYVSDGTVTTNTTLQFTVNAINDVPVISGTSNMTVSEDSVSSTQFSVSDLETAAGSVVISFGSSNTALLPVSNILKSNVNGTVTVTMNPVANAFGTSTITIYVCDGLATTNTTIVYTVNPISDEPMISGTSNVTADEDAQTTMQFSVSDAETAAGSLVVSIKSSNTALLPESNIIKTNVNGTVTVTLNPVANASGISTITIRVFDGTVTVNTALLYTVNAVNDVPVISGTENVMTSEDAEATTQFSVGDIEAEAESLLVSFKSSNTALLPLSNIIKTNINGTVMVTMNPVANMVGTSTITIQVSDGTATANTTMLYTVNAVNDIPVIIGTQNITVNEDTVTTNVFTVNDIETAAGSLVVSFKSSNTALLPVSNIIKTNLNGTVTVTMNPVANAFGSSTITIQVFDGTATKNTAILYTVNPISDAPMISGTSNVTTSEDTQTTTQFSVSDA